MRQDPTDPAPRDEEREKRIVAHFYTLLTSASLGDHADVPEELRDVDKITEAHAMLLGIRNLAFALAGGDLKFTCAERGFVVGALKSLQSNLRCLTQQTRSIASGNYCRVDFLGDFSSAFNSMSEQIAGRLTTLAGITERYKELSLRDQLTGLYNRHAFFLFAEELLHRNSPLLESTLIIADIDHFKKINDSFGHPAGDEVLRSISATLLSLLRENDLCCRYGGEEFIILMPGATPRAGFSTAERLRAEIEKTPVNYESETIRITASFGLCAMENSHRQENFGGYLEHCIRIADENLYRAKAEGRNRVEA